MTSSDDMPQGWRAHTVGYLKRLMVAALFGLFVEILLNWFHDTLPVIQFERAGSDAAMRYYAWQQTRHAGNASPKVVVVILGSVEGEGAQSQPSNGTAKGLTKLLRTVRQSGAAAVLLDIQIETTVKEEALAALESELKQRRGGNVIAIPLHVAPFREQQVGLFRDDWQAQTKLDVFSALRERPDLGYIRWVVPAIHADSDGVVRKVVPWACVLPADGAWTTYPTLAFAVPSQHFSPGDFRASCPNPHPGRQDILYRSGDTTIGAPIPVLPGDQVTSDPSAAAKQLQGAVVLIGQLSWEDTHLTPLGPMPGVLVQANAVSTALENYPSYRSGETLRLTFEIFSVALVLAFFPLVQFWIVSPPFALLRCMQRQFGATTYVEMPKVQWILTDVKPGNASCSAVARAFADFVAGAIAIGLLGWGVWYVLGGVLLDFATRQLSYGVVVGTFVPLLAVALEIFADTAEHFVRFADVLVDFVWSLLGRLLMFLGQLLGMEAR